MTDMLEWDDDVSYDDKTDDDVIELTDIVEEGSDIKRDNSIIELTEVVDDRTDADMQGPVPAAPEDIRLDDFEAALEKVIEKKFADKIETILFEVMERVIEKEIMQIRNSLQQDLDQIGKS